MSNLKNMRKSIVVYIIVVFYTISLLSQASQPFIPITTNQTVYSTVNTSNLPNEYFLETKSPASPIVVDQNAKTPKSFTEIFDLKLDEGVDFDRERYPDLNTGYYTGDIDDLYESKKSVVEKVIDKVEDKLEDASTENEINNSFNNDNSSSISNDRVQENESTSNMLMLFNLILMPIGAIYCYNKALNKNRKGYLWFILGLCFPIIASIFISLLKPKMAWEKVV